MSSDRSYRRFSENTFELGLFGFNVQNGLARLKGLHWSSTWEQNVELARLAEDAGFDFLLPLGSWRGRRGLERESHEEGGAYETLAWAAGLLASTTRIPVFGTLHVAYVNPIFAAKQLATISHIGRGRFGLNVVSGTSARDFAMFGLTPHDHDTQYDYTEEWLEIVHRAWNEHDLFDFEGNYFSLREIQSKPKPYSGQRPMLISAGHSQRGREFALRYADALFTSVTELENAAIELSMARGGAGSATEPTPIYGSCQVFCRRTRNEVEEYYHHVVYDLGEWDDIDALVSRGQQNRTMSYASMVQFKERQISGLGTLLIKGNFDDVARTFATLHEAGFGGMAVALLDYLSDAAVLRDEIFPRLQRLGMRSTADISQLGVH